MAGPNPARPFTMLRAGPGTLRRAGPACGIFARELTISTLAVPLCSLEDQDRMKKIALLVCLLAAWGIAGRAQESRQHISLSGTALIEPFKASSTTVQVNSTTAYG